MPHSDHEWGEGAWLGGCDLQWSAPGIEGWKTLDGQRIICQRRTIALSESAG